MRAALKHILMAFGAGALGGFVNAICVWALGALAVTAYFGVDIHPPLAKSIIYSRVTWGGIWGGILFLPYILTIWPVRKPVINGLLLSLLPSINTLFFLMPSGAAGLMGQQLGTLTPLFVLFFNAIWGVTAMLAYNAARR